LRWITDSILSIDSVCVEYIDSMCNKLNETCVYYFDKRLYRDLVSEVESNHMVEKYNLITKQQLKLIDKMVS